MTEFHFHLGRTPRPPTRAMRSDVIRLVLMAALLVVILVSILNRGMMSPVDRRESAPTSAPSGEDTHVVWLTMPAGRPAETQPAVPQGGTQPAWPTTETAGLPTGIDRALLNDVRDLLEIESGPYYQALRAVRALPSAAFWQPGLPQVSVPDLLNHPALYRGKLVVVAGNCRRLDRVRLPTNPAELDHIYEGQIRDDTSAFYTFVTTNDPPRDIEIGRDVIFSGVFFKVWVYHDREGRLRRSPLILGRDLHLALQSAGAAHRLPVILSSVMVGLLVVALAFILWHYRRSDRRFRRRFRIPPPDALAGFPKETDRDHEQV